MRVDLFWALMILSHAIAIGNPQHVDASARIGILSAVSVPQSAPLIDAFKRDLHTLGHVAGQDVVFEIRYADGEADRFAALAEDLVRLKVDVIVAPNNPAIAAAMRATKSIPIVTGSATDPVANGFIASLARPGGNVTGLSSQEVEVAGKRLQLLLDSVRNVSRVGVLWDPSEPGRELPVTATEAVARSLGVQLQAVEARDPSQLDTYFATIVRQGGGAVLVGGSSMLFARRAHIAELASKWRLPAMCAAREYVEAGCLLSYFPSLRDLVRRAAGYVDRILRGANPADLPVEQPTKFDLVINLKTAKVLGLTLPQSLLLRADEVIQ